MSGAKGRKQRRRGSSPHRGVVLIAPRASGRHPTWRARFIDPDLGKQVWVRLDALSYPTAETRRDWAIRKAKAIARRKAELEEGAPRKTGTAVADAVKKYYDAHPQLRDKTLAAYQGGTDKLVAWAKTAGVRSADDLTLAKLLEFRAELMREKKAEPVKGGKRREAKPKTSKPRSPHTINREFRSVNTVLRYLRDLALLPKVSHEELRRAFKRVPAPLDRLDYLKPAECRALLEAAMRHDAETVISREEEQEIRREAKARGVSRAAMAAIRPRGSTPRYDAIAPFVAFVLLTGMRLAEAVELDWSQVDLDALDHDGKKVGEIYLRGTETKTHKGRTVGLEVSPALRSMLAAMHLQSGGKGRVFGSLTAGTAEAAAKRLRKGYGAPQSFGWQMLRRTAGTYLTNAHGIFGGASAYRSAKQLGHSVQVAERHYVDVVRGIPREARTLEAAMQIEEQVEQMIARIQSRHDSAHGGADPRPVALRSVQVG